jgi:hypothetical protein
LELLEVTDFSDFKSRVPKRLSSVLKDQNSSDFKSFYKFVFCFHREGNSKNVELATCHMLLKMLFSDKYPILHTFIKFTDDKGITHMTLDQWESLYDLMKENPDNLDNYDEMAAWPTLMDEFYEWYKEQ